MIFPDVSEASDRPPREFAAPASPADREACLRLGLVRGIGPKSFAFLMSRPEIAGVPPSPAAILASDDALIQALDAAGVGPRRMLEGVRQARAVDLTPGQSSDWVCYCDPAYPPRLRHIPSPPILLWYRGRPPRFGQCRVAMVGSRRSTGYGRRMASRLARDLSRAGVEVVSGLAQGIDGAAHRGALEGTAGTTAVLAGGVDRIFPVVHHPLAERIMANGTILSELAPGTPNLSGHFLSRNRIIVGLAVATIVVEAHGKGGAMTTAELTLQAGRALYAVPGDVGRAANEGSNRLLSSGQGLVLTSAADLLAHLGVDDGDSTQTGSVATGPLKALASTPMTVAQLCAASGMAVSEVLQALMEMELDGVVTKEPGGLYRRI